MPTPTTAGDSRTLLLYGTEHCQLCDQAVLVLHGLTVLHDWVLEWIDIAEDDELVARYGTSIPVLEWPARRKQLCWPFDGDAVLQLLELE